MPRTKRKPSSNHISGDYNLGGEQAEADPLLQLAFVDTDAYLAIASPEEPRCFIIARTGTGKSAALQRLEEQRPDKVIRISPEDLSLPYVTDLQVFRYLESLGVHLDLFFVALWKHVLLVEIIRHRYKVDSPAAKQNFIAELTNRIRRDPTKLAALSYLNEFQDKFWCEADERVREITSRFEKDVGKAAGIYGSAPVGGFELGAHQATSLSSEKRAEEADRYQRVVNQFQLARLNKMIGILDEEILDSPNHQTYIVIDDLDRQWVEQRVADGLIRCLFRAILDLKRVKHLKILVALRTNIFEQLNFAAWPGGQEEKLQSLVLKVRWRPADLEQVLDARVTVASEKRGMVSPNSIAELLPAVNKTRGNPLQYVLSRSLMRPRDVISYLNEALSLAHGKTRLTWDHLYKAERAYSEGRLKAIDFEWLNNYPDMIAVLRCFEGAQTPMSRDEFTAHLLDIMVLPADRAFRGVTWVTRVSETFWETPLGDHVEWTKLYQPLTEVLYEIGFIGCARRSSDEPTFSYDDISFAARPSNLSDTCCFHIQPMFWAALDIRAGRHRAPNDARAEAEQEVT